MGVKIRLCGLGMGAVWYCGMVVLRIVLYWRRYILCSIDFDAFKKDGREGQYSSWDPRTGVFVAKRPGPEKPKRIDRTDVAGPAEKEPNRLHPKAKRPTRLGSAAEGQAEL